MKYLSINRKTKIAAGIGMSFIVMGLGFQMAKSINGWFDTHTLQFNQMINVEFKKPVEVKAREIPTKEIVRIVEEVPEPQDLETDPEKYIYEVFGIEDYKVAISVAKAESGMREDAIGINTNGTVDVGIFQINSVHFKQDGCALKDIVTYKGNIDCAKRIYDASGWNAWVAYKTGSFLPKLSER